MQKKCDNVLRERYIKYYYTLVRIKNFFGNLIIVAVLGVLLYFIGKADTNLINWIFFSLNVINFAIMAKNDNKPSTNKKSLFFARMIKVYSGLILLFDIGFILVLGEEESVEADSWDQKFKRKYPYFYKYLDFIGLRLSEYELKLDEKER